MPRLVTVQLLITVADTLKRVFPDPPQALAAELPSAIAATLRALLPDVTSSPRVSGSAICRRAAAKLERAQQACAAGVRSRRAQARAGDARLAIPRVRST